MSKSKHKNNQPRDKVYQKLAKLGSNALDLLAIICKHTLEKIASGKKVHYFEKKAQRALDTIFQIRHDKLFGIL